MVGVNPGKGTGSDGQILHQGIQLGLRLVFFSFWLVVRAGISKKVTFPDSCSPISMEASGFHHLLSMESLEDKEWLLFLVMGNALLPSQGWW